MQNTITPPATVSLPPVPQQKPRGSNRPLLSSKRRDCGLTEHHGNPEGHLRRDPVPYQLLVKLIRAYGLKLRQEARKDLQNSTFQACAFLASSQVAIIQH